MKKIENKDWYKEDEERIDKMSHSFRVLCANDVYGGGLPDFDKAFRMIVQPLLVERRYLYNRISDDTVNNLQPREEERHIEIPKGFYNCLKCEVDNEPDEEDISDDDKEYHRAFNSGFVTGVKEARAAEIKQEPLSEKEIERYCNQQLVILYKNQRMDTMGAGYANAMNDVLEKIKQLKK